MLWMPCLLSTISFQCKHHRIYARAQHSEPVLQENRSSPISAKASGDAVQACSSSANERSFSVPQPSAAFSAAAELVTQVDEVAMPNIAALLRERASICESLATELEQMIERRNGLAEARRASSSRRQSSS